MYGYFKRISSVGSGICIQFWKSKGLCDGNITASTTSNYLLNPQLIYFGIKTREKFSESCLKQDKITYDPGKLVKIYLSYEIIKNFYNSDHPSLENCLFGAASLTKNADIDNYKYSGYGIGFDRHGFFSHPIAVIGIYVIIVGLDMSSFTKIDDRKKRYNKDQNKHCPMKK